jgi:hypothetical protein
VKELSSIFAEKITFAGSMNRKTDNRTFLYTGLIFLAIAFAVKWFCPAPWVFCYWVLLGVGIVFKCIFLVGVLLRRETKPGVWVWLILLGVVMMLVSFVFKGLYPVTVVRWMLFYGAIVLKVSGVGLMMMRRK